MASKTTKPAKPQFTTFQDIRESLTLGEKSMIEEFGGEKLLALNEDNPPGHRTIAAMVVVTMRRNGKPTFKIGDALALTDPEVDEIIGTDDEDTDASDPTPPTEQNAEPSN